MDYDSPVNYIETRMMQRKTYRRGIDLKVVSEKYYPPINRFVVIYEPIEQNTDISEKIPAHIIEKDFDEFEVENILRTHRKNMCEIRRLYPNIALQLEDIRKHELIQMLWSKCAFEKRASTMNGEMADFALFYSEDANGIPLVPLSQTVHENKISVVFYPLMDSKHVIPRLIPEEGYVENIDFNLL